MGGRMAEAGSWELVTPAEAGKPYRVRDPHGRMATLQSVPTWSDFDRLMRASLRWSDDPDLVDRALDRFRSNPWAFGYHVLEDEERAR